MGFSDLLEDIGGFGRFQWIHVTLLSIPGLLMASQNLLNNFTAGIPGHYCTIPNITHSTNDHNITAEQLDTDRLLRAYIPVDKDSSKFTKCTRYVEPQWHLAGVNITGSNFTDPEVETCQDGWTYQRTEFISTIVSEVSGGKSSDAKPSSLKPFSQMFKN